MPSTNGFIGRVNKLVATAQRLANAIRPKAEDNGALAEQELRSISRLLDQAENAMSDGREEARKKIEDEIDDLSTLIANLDGALATPGLSSAARREMKTLRRRRLARRTRLRGKLAMDFAGILKAAEIREMTALLGKARRDVAARKRAAAFLVTLLKVADAGLTIAAKL